MRGVRAATCLVALLTVLTACVVIPTDGPVTAGRAAGDLDGDQDVVVVLAQGPEPGADPERIVEGFLLASDAEVTGEFEKTRQFLANAASAEWDPGAGTVVTSTFEVEQTGDAQVTVELAVTGKVDADGRYTETPSDAVETLRYELVQNARGEWRIAYAPDVLVVTARRFAQQFRPTWLYFLTPDKKLLVPEVRWFRDRNVPTAAVRALLAGPSSWLQDAVVTAVPPGTQLKPAAVALEGKVAEMTLEPAAAVQDADRGLLLAQLGATLERLGVAELVVRAGGAPIGGEAAVLMPPDAGQLELLVDGRALRLVGGSAVAVDGVGAVEGEQPRSAARTADGGVRVALADPSRLVSVPVGGAEQRTLLRGPELAAPSVDRYAWVWTARGDAAGRLDAVRLDGTVVEVTADWLVGRTVEAVRVSRDGTRVAVVSRGPDGTTLEVAGVSRDQAGVPLTLGEAVRAGASLTPTRSVVWVDDVTLGVLADGDAGPTPHLVPVSGSSTPLPAVAEVVELAADRGTRSLYAVTADGDVRRHEGGTWVAVPGVTDVLEVDGAAFPG